MCIYEEYSSFALCGTESTICYLYLYFRVYPIISCILSQQYFIMLFYGSLNLISFSLLI